MNISTIRTMAVLAAACMLSTSSVLAKNNGGNGGNGGNQNNHGNASLKISIGGNQPHQANFKTGNVFKSDNSVKSKQFFNNSKSDCHDGHCYPKTYDCYHGNCYPLYYSYGYSSYCPSPLYPQVYAVPASVVEAGQAYEPFHSTYVVLPGDSFYTVSLKEYGTSANANLIAQFNHLAPSAALTLGQTLMLPSISANGQMSPSRAPAAEASQDVPIGNPVESPVVDSSPEAGTDDSAAPSDVIADASSIPATTDEAAQPEAHQAYEPFHSTYIVLPGDSFYTVSLKEYATSANANLIAQFNHLEPSAALTPGQTVTLPSISANGQMTLSQAPAAEKSQDMPIGSPVESPVVDSSPAAGTDLGQSALASLGSTMSKMLSPKTSNVSVKTSGTLVKAAAASIVSKPVQTVGPARPKVTAGSTLMVVGQAFGDKQGSARIRIGGLSLPIEVLEWTSGAVKIRLSTVDIHTTTNGDIEVMRADGSLASKTAIELSARDPSRLNEVTKDNFVSSKDETMPKKHQFPNF